MILEGKLLPRDKSRIGLAHKRIAKMEPLLRLRGITFPPLHIGTLNFEIYPALTLRSIYSLQWTALNRQEIKARDPNFKAEWWMLIPIWRINGKRVQAFILRTEANFHGDNVIEVIAPKWDSLQPYDWTTFALRKDFKRWWKGCVKHKQLKLSLGSAIANT